MRSVLWIMTIVGATLGCASTTSGSNAPPTTSEERDVSPAPDTAAAEAAVTDSATTDSAEVADVSAADASPDVQIVDVREEDVSVDVTPDVVSDASTDVAADTAPDATAPDATEAVSFEIEEVDIPVSRNILPGVLSPFARYRGRSHGANGTADRLRVRVEGSVASIDHVAIMRDDGAVVGNAFPSAGSDVGVDVDLSTTSLHFVRESWTTFTVVGTMNPIVARASVPAGVSAPLSGAAVRMMLQRGETRGLWNASYTRAFNIRVVTEGSRETLYALGTPTMGSNFMIARRSVPTIRPMVTDMPTPIVSDTPNLMYEWQVGADAVGAIAWKKMTFQVDIAGTVSLNQFQLVRDRLAVPGDQYEIVDPSNRSMRGLLPLVSGTYFITIRWNDEETVGAGSYHAYRLLALSSGVSSGDTIRVQPLRSGVSLPGTGWLTVNAYGASIGGHDIAGPSLIEILMSLPGFTATIPAAFMWSDISAVPHVALPHPMGSPDWTGDELLENFLGTQTLSR